MATNKELERMIMNVELAIGNVRSQINSLPTVWDHEKGNLSDNFLQLRSLQSRLIEVSTKLQLQHVDNYKKERSLTNE
jgi:hypothetical protein